MSSAAAGGCAHVATGAKLGRMTQMPDPAADVVPQWDLRHRLLRAREYAGLEQSELARELGVSRTTVSNAERGAHSPRRALILAWGLRCGVSLRWLETGQAGPSSTPPDSVRPLGLEPRTQWFRARRHLSIVEERAA